MTELRLYQQAAKAAIYDHLRTRSDNPCVVLPVGSGRTTLIASICRDAVRSNGRVLILEPNDEFVSATTEKIRRDFGCEFDNTRTKSIDLRPYVLVTSIESVDSRNHDAEAFDLVILNKAYLIPPRRDGAYRQFLTDARAVNPNLKTIGMAAIPYRLRTTPSCTAESITKGGYIDHVCFEVGVRDLIHNGHLCAVVTKAANHAVETNTLPAYGGEFVSTEAADRVDQPELVEAACAELVDSTRDRHGVLIFAANNINAMRIVGLLKKQHQIQAGLVSSDDSFQQRSDLSAQFYERRLKYVVIMHEPPAGFDAPHVDTVVLLRPTLSPGLYAYMIGQGLRQHSQKKNCLVLDFVGNALRHGPIDQIAGSLQGGRSNGQPRAQACPGCRTVVTDGCARCQECGNELPPIKHRRVIVAVSNSGTPHDNATTAEYAVSKMSYHVHTKRGASPQAPKSMRVDYQVGYDRRQSEFICLEHSGYARQKATEWWRQRSVKPVPATAELAVAIAEEGGLVRTERITVRREVGEKFDRIIAYELAPLPE